MINKILKSVREYKWYMIITPILIIVEVAAETYMPFFMTGYINRLENGQLDNLGKDSIFLLLIAIFSLILGVAAGFTAVVASSGFAKNLRSDIFAKVQTFSFAEIDKFSPAGILTRLTTDVNRVQQAFQMSTRMAFRAPVMLIFSMYFAYQLNPQLSGIFFIVVPVLGVAFFIIAKVAFPLIKKTFDTYDEMNSVVEENLRGIRVVKNFVRENAEIQKFMTKSEKIFKYHSKMDHIVQLNRPAMLICMYATMLGIAFFGAKLIVDSGNLEAYGFTTGMLTGYITYAMQILMSMNMLTMIVVMLIMSGASIQRVGEILNQEASIYDEKAEDIKPKDGSIEFLGVSFSYNKDKNVLENINLRIESGETVGILGGTGSSKSSLVMLIPRLYDANMGIVKVGGHDVRKYSLNTLRTDVSMVLQKNELFSGTIAENLRWGAPNATDEEILKACSIAQASEFINNMPHGINTVLAQGAANLSGGQRQRLCIARAILKNPKIIIFDDSTSAVDTRTDRLIQQGLYESLPGATKLIIAQRISSVQNADRIIVMDKGRIAAIGKHEELLESCDIYKEVYDSQASSREDE